MSVITYGFLLFLAVSLTLYYIVPGKLQWLVLLCASIFFYAMAGVEYLAIAVGTALAVYACSLLLQKNLDEQAKRLEGADRKAARVIRAEMKDKRRRVLQVGLVFIIGLMVLFKGSSFLVRNLNKLLGIFSLQGIPNWKLIAPLGISFYSFMMISYLMNIYNGKLSAEKNFLRYLTFVLYFPHITQGPIADYANVAPQLFSGHRFDYDALRKGAWLMLWGFFKKLVIADRMSLFVTTVFGSSSSYAGPIFLFAGIVYSIQIYCDFSGCMDIVRGASECFGITLQENFRRPYFSETLPEFWRRWHITLGAFFREFVFYPVSTSKVFLNLNALGRKYFGNETGRNIASCLPILCVWFLTGIWHGATWNFIGWGLYHGVLICLSTIFEQPLANLTARLKLNTTTFSWRLFRMLRTFLLCVIGRIISMGNGIRASLYMLKSMVTQPELYNIWDLGLNSRGWSLVLLCCILLLAVSIAQEYRENRGDGTIRDWLAQQGLWLRWIVLLTGLLAVFTFGVYGSGVGAAFIYEQF